MGFSRFQDIGIAAAAGKKQNLGFVKGAFTQTAATAGSLWTAGGTPSAGSYPGSALVAAVQNAATAGAIAFPNSVSPSKRFLTGAGAEIGLGSTAAYLVLLDRLLVYPGIDCSVNTLQTFNNTATLPRYTTGDQVVCFFECQSANSGAITSYDLIYVDESGNTKTNTGTTDPNPNVAARINPLTIFHPLTGASRGVRSLTSIQFTGSTHTGGTVAAVLAHPLAFIPLVNSANGAVGYGERDQMIQFLNLEQIQDSACLMLAIYTGSTISSTSIAGNLEAVIG